MDGMFGWRESQGWKRTLMTREGGRGVVLISG